MAWPWGSSAGPCAGFWWTSRARPSNPGAAARPDGLPESSRPVVDTCLSPAGRGRARRLARALGAGELHAGQAVVALRAVAVEPQVAVAIDGQQQAHAPRGAPLVELPPLDHQALAL